MRNLLKKVLIVFFVIIALGSLSSLFHGDEEPQSSTTEEKVARIELSDDELTI